jgi:hypothetical protein
MLPSSVTRGSMDCRVKPGNDAERVNKDGRATQLDRGSSGETGTTE